MPDKLKVLFVGNHTCANRGDCAILRGMISAFETAFSYADITVLSKFPEVASIMLQRPVDLDLLYSARKGRSTFTNRLLDRLGVEILYLKLRFPEILSAVPIPSRYRSVTKFLTQFDLILQVGGSYFTDVYGIRQYEWMMLALLTKKKVILSGHSLGPFESGLFYRFSKLILPKASSIILREKESLKLLEKIDISLNHVVVGGDTAWLLNGLFKPMTTDTTEIDLDQDKIVAITVRNLAPFNQRLGITQQDYEDKIKRLLDALIERGWSIVGLSMCTGLGGYNKDDRIVAHRIKQKLQHPEKMTVLWNEYTDIELGRILGNCNFLIGTRLHSAILSLLQNTPVIGIEYEHKFTGVFNQLDLSDFLFDMKSINSNKMMDKISEIEQEATRIREKINKSVDREYDRAGACIKELKKLLES